MKLSHRYEQTSCRLVVEGLPDVSAGQGSEALGILTGWTLTLAGHTELEGQRDHLVALARVVMPYARHLLSGVPQAFGDAESPVVIAPIGDRHRLSLRSSQPNTPALELQLDDAELADLVRCLDQLRLDPRLQVPLTLPLPQPLRRRQLRQRQPLLRRVAAPALGLAALTVTAALAWMVPVPRPSMAPPAPVTPTGTSGRPAR